MVTREDVESFLMRMEGSYEEVEPGMWVVGSDGGSLVLHHTPPLLVLRTKVLEVPDQDTTRCTELFRRLLELNASELVHGAYAIEGDDIILTDSLELEHLDFDTFQSAVDSVQLALASHLEKLAEYREC